MIDAKESWLNPKEQRQDADHSQRSMTFVSNYGIKKHFGGRMISHFNYEHSAKYGNSVQAESVTKIRSGFKEKL
jgi:hypothetical protein